MYNTDKKVGYDKFGSIEFVEIPFSFQLKGKEWARGYTAEVIAERERAFWRFDIRDWLRGLFRGK